MQIRAYAAPGPGAPLEHAATLMCAGITVYAPLSQDVHPAMRVGVVGVGGLGHLAVQYARAFGCEVTTTYSAVGVGNCTAASGMYEGTCCVCLL